MEKKIKGRNPYWKLGAVKYIHKNKKKYNRKNMSKIDIDNKFKLPNDIQYAQYQIDKNFKDIYDLVNDGELDPLKAFLFLKQIEEKTKEYKRKIEEMALDELSKYGGESVEIDGYNVNLKKSAGRWDFKHLEEITVAEQKLKDLKEKYKGAYKQMLNNVTSLGEGGEVIVPANFKQGKEIISVSKKHG